MPNLLPNRTAASAQNLTDQQFADEIGDSGSSGNPLLRGFQLVTFSQFRSGVESGAIKPVSYNILLQQEEARAAKDQANQTTINNFLTAHPELTSLAQMVATDPQPSLTVVPSGQDWRIRLPNGTWTVTQGRSDKLAAIATSIVTAADPVVQLKLYTDIYNALPPAYLQSFLVTEFGPQPPPPPASLANASLTDIQTALHPLTSDWQRIGFYVTNVPPLGPVACSSEVGAGKFHQNYYGDGIGCGSPPSPSGVYANYDFPLKSFLTCMKWQGNRDTCHIFANTSAVEMLIAQKYALHVNLSEQDFMEHYRFEWNPEFFNGGGSIFESAGGAINHQYSFAYENRWDYNPSFNRQAITVSFLGLTLYSSSCLYYPEWCSDTSPQAPVICAPFKLHIYCGFYSPPLVPSGYQITAFHGFWDPGDLDASMKGLLTELTLARAVTMGLQITPAFQNPGTLGSSNRGFVVYNTDDIKTGVGGHVVHIVGFISDEALHQILPNAPSEEGHPWFNIKNSWSDCWGDGGFGYVSWNYIRNQSKGAMAITGVN